MAKDESCSNTSGEACDPLNFEKMLHRGENPRGFTAQTPNGTAKWKGTGWNRQFNYEQEQVEPKGPWRGGRSNRTGE